MRSDPELTADILIVEDDEDTRETLALILEGEGYRVAAAANGQEALERLRAGPVPGVILLDLMMPVMDGWEFRRRQREDPALAAIPVVVVTGADRVEPVSEPLGAAGYLPKPVRIPTLLQLLDGLRG